MKRPTIIGIMGGGRTTPKDSQAAFRLGSLIAQEGWVLLNGGRNAGIMEASARGAKMNGGLTVGVLADDNCRNLSKFIDIPIVTGMGNARNCINVLSSQVVVACPGGAGTISEIALALKNNRVVILLNFDIGEIFDIYKNKGLLKWAKTPEEVIDLIKEIIFVYAGNR